MKLHYLQHEPYEGLYLIEEWADKNRMELSSTKFYENDKLPDMKDFDFLVIMGGSMSTYEDNKFKWMKEEKKFIEKAINKNKAVLGICLGSQLLADVLGAKVYKNRYKEIGWLPVYKKNIDMSETIIKNFPDKLVCLQWHGDTFDIPGDAIHFATSEACENQAFIYNDRVLALQFHIETSMESIDGLVKNCGRELKNKENKFIQNETEINILSKHFIPKANEVLTGILDNIKSLK